MVSKGSFRFMTAILAVALCVTAFPVSVLAYGTDTGKTLPGDAEVIILTDEEASNQVSSLFV